MKDIERCRFEENGRGTICENYSGEVFGTLVHN